MIDYTNSNDNLENMTINNALVLNCSGKTYANL